MTDTQLIPYCAQTSCLDCEHSVDCDRFYHDHGRLPYLFFKPYVPEPTDVDVPFINRKGRKIENCGRKKNK